MPLIGEKIRLNLQLWDGATNKYIRAFLYDADGVQIASINMTHVGRGLYEDSSLFMPDTAEVRAVYKVYSNSSYTQVSSKHSDSLDVYFLETGMSSGSGCEIVGVIETGTELIGSVADEVGLIGEIEECDLINGSPPC